MPSPEAIRHAAREVVAAMTGSHVSDQEPLISSGRIDSLSILRLISQLEAKLGIHISSELLQPDDFENINCITDTVLLAAAE